MKHIITTITLTLSVALGSLERVQADALVYTPPAQGLSNNFASTLGYEFTPSSPLWVYSLGFADLPSADVPSFSDGLKQPRFVGLWDSNGLLLTSVIVPAGTAAPLMDRFRYQDLPTPITLAAGQTYILGAYFNRESDDHYTVNDGTSYLTSLGAGRSALGQTFPDTVNNTRVFGPNLLAYFIGPASGLYRITSGSYLECCGSGGDFRQSLPSKTQAFVRLTADPRSRLATMTFLGEDSRTVFSVVPCPPGDPINFSFDFGFIGPNSVLFHVDPGPPPYGIYWSSTVSNSADSLRIDGILGTALQNCADLPTQFSHSNVVAVLVPGPRLRITEFSKDGALLFIQGNAGWTNVIEASTDLVTWRPIGTNFMPGGGCPVCPYILVRDAASTNLVRRFYRCYEFP